MRLFLIKIRRDLKFWLNLGLQKRLKALPEAEIEKKRFQKIRSSLRELLKSIKKQDNENFMTPCWKKFVRQIERMFDSDVPFEFLANPVVLFTMFATVGGEYMKKQLSYIESRLGYDEAARLRKKTEKGESR